MEKRIQKIAFGGGCHWCTEAVFQSLKGVVKVEQGFVASIGEYTAFSEAVIVHFNPLLIPLTVLVEIHLNTHKSTSNHSMRDKYRSAIYTINTLQHEDVKQLLKQFQITFNGALITQVLPFKSFKPSQAQFKDYYYSNPEKPFCKTFINPKLKLLLERFSSYTEIKSR
jgi:peptide-methionine (S)-S-oxide reductase